MLAETDTLSRIRTRLFRLCMTGELLPRTRLTDRPLHILCTHPSRPLVRIVTRCGSLLDLWFVFWTRGARLGNG